MSRRAKTRKDCETCGPNTTHHVDPDSPAAILERNAAATEHNLAVHEQAKRGVGRPLKGAKKRQKLSISLDPEVLAQVRAAAGKGKLSTWLEAAAVAHLRADHDD